MIATGRSNTIGEATSALSRGRTFEPHRHPFMLKVPYVALVLTPGFQPFLFVPFRCPRLEQLIDNSESRGILQVKTLDVPSDSSAFRERSRLTRSTGNRQQRCHSDCSNLPCRGTSTGQGVVGAVAFLTLQCNLDLHQSAELASTGVILLPMGTMGLVVSTRMTKIFRDYGDFFVPPNSLIMPHTITARIKTTAYSVSGIHVT